MFFHFNKKYLPDILMCCNKRQSDNTSNGNTSFCCQNRKTFQTEMEEICNCREKRKRRLSSDSAEKYTSETLHSAFWDDVAFFTPRSYFHKVEINYPEVIPNTYFELV